MDNSKAIIEIAGHAFSGWENFGASFDMDSLVPVLSVDYYDRTNQIHRAIKEGLAVTLFIQKDENSTPEQVIPGFVTNRTRDKSAGTMSASFDASHSLIDIVECSAIVKSQSWRSAKFTRIISEILKPFNIKLNSSKLKSDPVIEKFKLESGETAFDAIERLCRSQAVIPFADADRDFHLVYSDTVASADENLEGGRNIISIRENEKYEERFSEYHGIAQYPSRGKKWTREMLEGKQSAFDEGVSRYRPMLFIAENRNDRKTLASRVAWEAQVRAGRAIEHTVKVKGWYQKDDNGRPIRLWKRNETVRLIDEDLDIDQDRLITAVDFTHGTSGKLTQLVLRHPNVFRQNPSESVKLS
jgi:prophage tail gpP-like protein